MQKEDAKVKCLWKLFLALCNRKQDTTVMRTSPTTVWSINKARGIDSTKMALPASTFTTIESDWLAARKLKGLKAQTKDVP